MNINERNRVETYQVMWTIMTIEKKKKNYVLSNQNCNCMSSTFLCCLIKISMFVVVPWNM